MQVMSNKQIFYMVSSHMVALVFLVIFLVIIFIKAKRNNISIIFMNVQVVLCLWITAKILKTVAPTDNLRWAFVAAEFVITAFLGISVFQLAYIYTNKKLMRIRSRYILYAIPIIMGGIVVANPIHKMVYPDFSASEFVYGPFFYIHLGIVYFFLFSGMLQIIYTYVRGLYENNKGKSLLLPLVTIIPWTMNYLFISGRLEGLFIFLGIDVAFDVTPIFAAITIFLFAYMIFKYEFIDMMPILKEKILHIMDKAIIIVNCNGQIIDYNYMADELFSFSDNNYKSLEQLDSDNAFYDVCEQVESGKWIFEKQIDTKFYEVRVKDLEKNGKVIILTNINDYVELRLEKMNKNKRILQANVEMEQKIKLSKQVAKLNARNSLSRELHDVLGHSIIVAIKLLEVIKIQSKDDQAILFENKNFVLEKLNQASSVITSSYKEIIKSILRDGDEGEAEYDTKRLKYELLKLVGIINISNLEIDLKYEEESQPISKACYKAIKRIIQEGITNAIKHGKASKIYILIIHEGSHCRINLRDNGIGCEKVIFGNGLLGMQQRVSSLKGNFNYYTSKTEGFSLDIEL